MKIKKRIFEIIQIGKKDDFASKFFDIFIAVTITVNISILFLETFSELALYYPVLRMIEIITIFIFCVEYLLRIWTADYLYPDKKKGAAVLKFLLSYDGVIDLLTILPFFFLSGFVAFRMLRVVRIFNLFRINAKYDSFNVITTVLYDKKDQILSSVFIILILMMASSLCMYSAEHEIQPDKFNNAFSGIWWSVSTLLTVGYGDIYPITALGKCMAIIIGFLGVGVVAIPTGIISAGFVEQYTKIKSVSNYEEEANIKFVTLTVDNTPYWKNKTVKDLKLPQGLILALILRKGEVVIPKGDVVLTAGDRLVLGAEAFQDEINIKLKEIIVKQMHSWNGQAIKDMDISRQTIILMIRRKNRVIIPNGDTVIKAGDVVILYSKHNLKEAININI